MNKTMVIIEREFMTRVRKKSFIILTICVPLFIVAIYAFMMWMMMRDDNEQRSIVVVNESTLEQPMEQINNTNFVEPTETITHENAGEYLKKSGDYAVMWIPKNVMEHPDLTIYSFAQIPLELKNSITNQLKTKIEKIKRDEIIERTNIPDLEEELNATKTDVVMQTLVIKEGGDIKESSSEIASVFGLVGGIIIYSFIFMYAMMVMKGVMEEKSNRIIEVLVSSVKPFQFLMGKIIGVASVGLVQFAIWIVIILISIGVIGTFFMPSIDMKTLKNAGDMASMGGNLSSLNVSGNPIVDIVNKIDSGMVVTFLISFIFYFIGGYLLYASLFAAIGAAVDSEEDTQQFMTPLSIILVIGLYIGIGAARNPESSLSIWSSIIPFTSPIVMLVRVPFGVPTWQLTLSIVLLIGTFIFFTWLSSKIYRIGILMYGKKVTFKELWKWIRYEK